VKPNKRDGTVIAQIKESSNVAAVRQYSLSFTQGQGQDWKNLILTIKSKEPVMNKDIIKGKWNQLKGEIKVQWGKLTDDELDQIDGNYDKMVGKLQEKYGYQKDQAEKEAEQFFKSHR
jgi:uncharacterized protein YjbJ (UPF0337 family)